MLSLCTLRSRFVCLARSSSVDGDLHELRVQPERETRKQNQHQLGSQKLAFEKSILHIFFRLSLLFLCFAPFAIRALVDVKLSFSHPRPTLSSVLPC